MAEFEIQSSNSPQSNLYLVLPSDVHCRNFGFLKPFLSRLSILPHILESQGKDRKHKFLFS